MQPFPVPFTAIAAPLPIENVDTDMIIPKQFLKTIKRTGLKEGLFYEMRFRVDGSKVEDFILHREPFTHAGIILSGSNFGCGSSREHAPWALLDFGVRSIIAPSFADIFYNNCFKNGILPIVLPRDAVDALMQAAQASPQTPISIDLPNQKVISPAATYAFEVEPFRKQCLLEGLDDIGLTLQQIAAIDGFESRQRENLPWLYSTG